MGLEQVLQTTKPDINLWVVLLTFAGAAFAAGRFFWKYEKDLGEENIERIKDLIDGFRRLHIEPIFSKELSIARDTGYYSAVKGLIGELYSKSYSESGEIQQKLVEHDKLKDILQINELNKRIERDKAETKIEVFLSSDPARELFDNLDHAYERKSYLSGYYNNACISCAKASYSFFTLSFLLFSGMLQIVLQWSGLFLSFWLFTSILVLVYGIYSLVKLEYYRRKLFTLWKELKFYGKI